MIADFEIISGETVTPAYRWDDGVPFLPGSGAQTVPAVRDAETDVIRGYAPGLQVRFANTTQIDPTFANQVYRWNFGDTYNSIGNNIAISCLSSVDHVYVMPGKYTVTLSTRAIRRSIVIDGGFGDPVLGPDGLYRGGSPNYCLSKFNIRWFWDNIHSSKLNKKTWEETQCNGPFPKWWDPETLCLQRHCKFWLWYDTACSTGTNPITWAQTKTGGQFEKLWTFEANTTQCQLEDELSFFSTFEENTDSIIKTAIIEVLEIPPVAGMHSETQPPVGPSPLQIRLTPKTTKTGSFSIDRIDWDFNDGTPIKSVTRHTRPDSNIFVNNNTYFGDPNDPRNFDAIYNYRRNRQTYAMFYPSITCYSSNTNTFDSCSITIGPVEYPPAAFDAQILDVKNTVKGNLYSIELSGVVGYTSTATTVPTKPVKVKTPPNRIRNTFNTVTVYPSGNPGLNYPPPFINPCTQAILPPILEPLPINALFYNQVPLVYISEFISYNP